MDDPQASLSELVKQFLNIRGTGEKYASRIHWRDLEVTGAGLAVFFSIRRIFAELTDS